MALVDYAGAKVKASLTTDGELTLSLTGIGEYGRNNRRSAAADVPLTSGDTEKLTAILRDILEAHAMELEEAGVGAASEALAVARAKKETI